MVAPPPCGWCCFSHPLFPALTHPPFRAGCLATSFFWSCCLPLSFLWAVLLPRQKQHHPEGERRKHCTTQRRGRNSNTISMRRRQSSTTQRTGKAAPPNGGEGRQHHPKGGGTARSTEPNFIFWMSQYSVGLASFHSKKRRTVAPPKEGRGRQHHQKKMVNAARGNRTTAQKTEAGEVHPSFLVGAAFPFHPEGWCCFTSFTFGWGLLSLYPLAGGAVFSPLLLWVVLFFILLGGSIFPICFEK